MKKSIVSKANLLLKTHEVLGDWVSVANYFCMTMDEIFSCLSEAGVKICEKS